MYKVFIDNWKLILREDFKNSSVTHSSDFVFHKGLRIEDLVSKRLEDDESSISLFYDGSTDKMLKKLFKSYKWVEAAGGIVRKEEEFLVIFRNGKWDLPKGKIDKGEKKKQAAVREVEEECGIKNPRITKKLTPTYHTYNVYGPNSIKKTSWYEMEYFGDDILTAQENEGITRVEWVTKDFLLEMKSNTYASIAELLEYYLAQ